MIYAFYTVTKIKFLAIFRERPLEKYEDDKVRAFFLKMYKLYKKELYQPFENALEAVSYTHLTLPTTPYV